jgi:hypothetical protein
MSQEVKYQSVYDGVAETIVFCEEHSRIVTCLILRGNQVLFIYPSDKDCVMCNLPNSIRQYLLER